MFFLLLKALILHMPVVLPAQPSSCGEVCYYDAQFQIADCSGIGLQAVPTKEGCESARLLDLSYNNIASLHESDMIGNRGAQHLDLSFNGITTVEPRSFSGGNVVIYLNLYLSSNKIAILRDETFNECEESLQQLHLDRNNIEVIEKGALKGLVKLGHLFLGHNNLQSLEASTFHDLISLESLYLNSNRLISLPGHLFSTLNRLKYLDLSSNNLLLLGDELFSQRYQLTTVILANNRLLNIPNQSKNPSLSRLQALDVRNNNISDASNITQYLYATEKLFIDGNPFHCDCNLEDLRQWAQQEVTNVDLTCIIPSSGERRDVQALPTLCSTGSPNANGIMEQTVSREIEQGDTNTQEAHLDSHPGSKKTLNSSTDSKNIVAKQNEKDGGAAEYKMSGVATSESLEDKGLSWPFYMSVFVTLIFIVFATIILIVIRIRYYKSPKETPVKPPHNTNASTPMGSPGSTKIDMSNVRHRTPQSTHKTNDGHSPEMVKTKQEQDASRITSGHVRSSDDKHTGKKTNLARTRLDKKYELSSPSKVKESELLCSPDSKDEENDKESYLNQSYHDDSE